MGVFDAKVDVAFGRPNGNCGDRHSLDENERIAFHEHAVRERAGIALVRVAGDVLLIGGLIEHSLPFDAGWKGRAAASAQPGIDHFLHDRGGADPERSRQAPVTVMDR